MNLFDKKYVYLEWDSVLEGKQAVIGDTLGELRKRLDRGLVVPVAENEGDYPFTKADSIEEINYALCYYDPLYNVKLAWKQGKQIQARVTGSKGNWVDLDNPNWEFVGYDYRVKPEKQWRPFKDIRELKDTWLHKRYNATAIISPLEEPMIWLRSKSNTTSTYLITHYCENMGVVYLCGYLNVSLDQLFEDYTFLDGTPCGVEE